MNKELLYGIIGLLAGVVISGFAASNAVNTNNTGMMQMMGIRTNAYPSMMQNTTDEDASESTMMKNNASMSMNGMVHGLTNKTGDDFDKAFLSEMIAHHQGAIDMAKLSAKNAKHEELKKLSEDIITAQTKEIAEMQLWQKEWGYTK